MGFGEILLIGVGLSMDAFAVAVCKGLNMKKINWKYAAVIALFFGGFQALMPAAGYFLGKSFERYIVSFDHWIAFLLLLFIGGKMALESFKKDDGEGESCPVGIDLKELTMLAVATSIDALAVGITFAFLGVDIGMAATTIGITTFVLSIAGVMIGNYFGAKYKSKAEFLGGVILILIGAKILLEHLGIL